MMQRRRRYCGNSASYCGKSTSGARAMARPLESREALTLTTEDFGEGLADGLRVTRQGRERD